MSHWTHICGTITVSPIGWTQAQKRYVLDTVLDHLPVVSGSEEDMKVHVVQRCGYNSSSSHNEFEEPVRQRPGSRDGWMRIQDEYIVAIEGDLRDRRVSETVRELSKWLCRLAKRVFIDDIIVKISGSYENDFIISDPGPYQSMEEPFSWMKESNGEPAWAEFLLWDRMKNGRYPLKLYYKYYEDPENDAEFERRAQWERD